MTDSGFRIPKSVAAAMVDELHNSDIKGIKTVYNTNVTNSKSHRQ